MNRLALSMVLGLALTGLAVPRQADAVPTLWLSDGVNSVMVSDGGAGDLNSVAGAVTLATNLGRWAINVTTGLTYPALGTADSPQLELSSLNVSSSRGGSSTLTIMFSQTGFTSLGGDWNASWGGISTGTVQYQTYMDGTNTIFGTGTALTNTGLLTAGPFSGTNTSDAIVGAPYSLTQLVTINHGRGVNLSSFNAELSGGVSRGVPEPSTLLLLGVGFLGLALWRRKEASA